MSSPKSRIGALWVIQPEEIRSTPVAATAATVSRLIRPEASVTARPSTIVTARRRVSGAILSSNTASTPTSSASASWSRESTASSILTRCPACCRASSSAGPTPPAIAMWLSLISIASSSPKRWLAPPPDRTASFSKVRSPGVVLRVHTILALKPVIASANARVAVATPDIRLKRLSAVRSAASTGRDRIAAGDAGAVGAQPLDTQFWVEQLESEERGIQAGDDPRLARHDHRLNLRMLWHDRVGRDVTGAAQILEQRRPHDRLDDQPHDHRVLSPSAEDQHALDRLARAVGDRRIDGDLVAHGFERTADLRQRDALHMRAQIARPHKVEIGVLQRHIVAHRAFGQQDDAGRVFPTDIVGHRRG